MTKIKMPLNLEKLIENVKDERILWYWKDEKVSPEEQMKAWDRIGAKYLIAGSEAKNIFAVLRKKYYQEAEKPSTHWELFTKFSFLEEISKKPSTVYQQQPQQSSPSPSSSNHEEETFVELVEVKDEEFSDDETTASIENNKEHVKSKIAYNNSANNKNSSNLNGKIMPIGKIKVIPPALEYKDRVISLKRKLSLEGSLPRDGIKQECPVKRPLRTNLSIKPTPTQLQQRQISSSSSPSLSSGSQQLNLSAIKSEIKTEINDLKRVAGASMSIASRSGTNSSNSVNMNNGCNVNVNRGGINVNRGGINISCGVRAAGAGGGGGTGIGTNTYTSTGVGEGSTAETDDSSKKHDSFGNYVSTTMNRLSSKLAAKLEIKILQAIIEVNSEMMNHLN